MNSADQRSPAQHTYLSAAIDAAHVGGRLLQDWIGRFSVREKSRANLVTEADEASQAAIVQTLKNQFPQHGFLGEENLNDRDAATAQNRINGMQESVDEGLGPLLEDLAAAQQRDREKA